MLSLSFRLTQRCFSRPNLLWILGNDDSASFISASSRTPLKSLPHSTYIVSAASFKKIKTNIFLIAILALNILGHRRNESYRLYIVVNVGFDVDLLNKATTKRHKNLNWFSRSKQLKSAKIKRKTTSHLTTILVIWYALMGEKLVWFFQKNI